MRTMVALARLQFEVIFISIYVFMGDVTESVLVKSKPWLRQQLLHRDRVLLELVSSL